MIDVFVSFKSTWYNFGSRKPFNIPNHRIREDILACCCIPCTNLPCFRCPTVTPYSSQKYLSIILIIFLISISNDNVLLLLFMMFLIIKY